MNSVRNELGSSQAKKKNKHMHPYSQIFGKEVGGLQKNEVPGLLFIWGSDQYGQLGLDAHISGKTQSS